MLWFVLGLILILVGLVCGLFFKGPAKLIALIPIFLAAMLITVSMITIVGPRAVGVEHRFNRTTGTNLEAGQHWKAPWNSVEDIDASIQPEEYKGDDCIRVKIADGTNACITMAYAWRVVADSADTVFKDYNKGDGPLETVRSSVVSPKMKAALNEVWGTFDPTNGIAITPDMTAQEISNIKINSIPNYGDYNQLITDNFEAKSADVGNVVELQSLTVSGITYSETTQKRLDTIKNKILDSKAALLDIAIKNAQAQGNVELAESLEDPNVLVSKCFDGLIEGDFSNQPGFSCWPGGGGGVVIPQAAK